MTGPIIDDTFKNLLPPLTEEQKLGLEQDIIKNGCLMPLITWNGILVDGHYRYDICKKNNIPFRTMEMAFKDKLGALSWSLLNQKNRRNMTKFQEIESILRNMKPLIAAEAKERQKEHGGTAPGKSKHFGRSSAEVFETRKEVAKLANISHDTVSRVEKIKKEGSDSLQEKVRTGDMSINEAYKEVKEIERKEQRKESVAPPPMPDGLFDVLYADPPWEYEHPISESRRIDQHYPTMTLDSIKALKIPAAENSVLFLWATTPKLTEALEVMSAWGFTYRTLAVWDKEKIGMGYWFRSQCELLLVGTKGKFPPPSPELRVGNVFKYPRGGHSVKPREIRDLIASWYLGYRKIELFSREKADGWEMIGIDIP